MVNVGIKRVYEPVEAGDGARVLVDRVWPRGVSREEAGLTLWLKDIAPSTDLRKWFGHDPARWDEFRRRYVSELDGNAAATEQIATLARKGHVTLLYGARDTEHNQAVVLADWLAKRRGDPNG